MLLRCSSTPIPNFYLPHSNESPSLEPETIPRFPRLTVSGDVSLQRTSSETNFWDTTVPKKNPNHYMNAISPYVEIKDIGHGRGTVAEEEGSVMLDRLFSSSGLVEQGCEVGGGDMGSGGGRGCGSGGSDFDDEEDGGGGKWNWDGGNNLTEIYYQEMIHANPGNALILSNYAKYLKEVKGEYVKAEEYCGRAILASPNDGNVLSLYGSLIWQSHQDAHRAETYFKQAIQMSPDDCYVQASYASFLWDAEEDIEEEEEEKKLGVISSYIHHDLVSWN